MGVRTWREPGRRIARALLVGAAGLAATACAPAVQHGPWVYEGASGGMRGAGAFVTRFESDYPALSLAFDAAVRHGWVPEDANTPAFAAGLQTSLWALFLAADIEDAEQLTYLFALDAYASLPTEGRHASSFGATVSRWHVMPYFQVGSREPGEGAWYTTQALLLATDDWSDVAFADFLWLPSFTWVDPDDGRGRAHHTTLGMGLGQDDGDWVLAFTASFGVEFFRRNARVR